jgi:hypothetical protein
MIVTNAEKYSSTGNSPTVVMASTPLPGRKASNRTPIVETIAAAPKPTSKRIFSLKGLLPFARTRPPSKVFPAPNRDKSLWPSDASALMLDLFKLQ